MTHHQHGSSDPLPYTQVDRAVKPKAAILSSMLGVTYQHALGSLIDFWDLCGDPRELERLLAEGKDEVSLTKEEVRMRFLMASGKDIEPSQLAALGILEPKGDLFRVRGMSRFFGPIKKRVTRREVGRAGGVASAAARRAKRGTAQPVRAVFGPCLDFAQPPPKQLRSNSEANPKQIGSKREHRVHSTEYRGQSLNYLAGETAPAEDKPTKTLKPQKPEKPTDPRHALMVTALVAVYAEENFGVTYAFSKRDASSVTELLAKSDDDEEILYRWRTALKAANNQYQSPKTRDLTAMVRDWNAYPVVKNADVTRELRL